MNIRPLSICMIGTWPAVDLLPAEAVKPRYRERKTAHPTSWLRALTFAMAARDDVEAVHVLVDSREVAHARTWSDGKLAVTFVPKLEPGQTDPFHLYLPARLRLAPWLRRLQPAIVHGHGTESANGWLAATSGYPNVISIQGIIEALLPDLGCSLVRGQLLAWMERRAARRCDALTVESEWALDWALRQRSAATIRCIPNAVNPEFMARQTDYTRKACVSIGTLTAFKNPGMVLRAFARVRASDAELIMIGDGPLRSRCKTMACELGIADRTVFTGRLSRAAVIEMLSSSRCLAIGSRVDTSPNVIPEAMAMGVPVIGTRAAGIPGLVRDGHDGFLVDVEDDEAMGRHMHDLLDQPDAAARLGAHGMERVRRKHAPAPVAQAYMEWYREIVTAHGRQLIT